jgi:hypothetical protein
MKLFAPPVMWLLRRGLVRSYQARAFLRWMAAYSLAIRQGQGLPDLPRSIVRASRPLGVLAAAFRLAQHEPGIFMLGLFCLPPAAMYLLWLGGQRVLRWTGV